MPTVLVTDAGRGNAVAIIRSLGRQGMRVIAADSHRMSPGFFSRYADDRVLYPPADASPDGAVAVLVEAAHRYGVDLIVPVTDELVLPLSAARSRFDGICALAIPPAPALARAHDKEATVDLARKLGIPTPQTVVVSSAAEAVERGSSLGWPVVLKPQVSRRVREGLPTEKFGVSYANDRAALHELTARLEGRCPVLLQEYCGGEGHGVGLLLDEGVPLAVFQHRRIREVPFTGGPSSLRESVPVDARLREYAERLLGSIAWTGLAMAEFKVAGSQAWLMEVNGRVWGSLPLAVKAGVDFPGLLAGLYLSPASGRRAPIDAYELGVRSRNLTLETAWIVSVLAGRRRYPFLPAPRRSEALIAAARLFSGRDGFDVLSRADLVPGLVELVQVASWGLGALGRRR